MSATGGGADNLPPDILRQAAAWFSNLADASASEADRHSWRVWLEADPRHVRAWRRVEDVMGQLASLAPTATAARRALDAPARTRRRVLGSLGALLVSGGALAWLPWRDWREDVAVRRADYHIALGKLVTLLLPDGTRIWLGSLSVLDLDYATDRRRLRLYQGDLLVETATDRQLPARAFNVDTPHGRLRALGTRFAVRAGASDTRVDVFEGGIELTPADASAPLHVVHAGEHAVFDRRALIAVGRASPSREAWSRGILAADHMRLDELAGELSRWHALRIECDADAAALQVVGGYPLQDLDRILGALAATLPVRILREQGQVRIAFAASREVPSGASSHDAAPRRIEPGAPSLR